MNRAKVHARLMELHSVAQRAIAAEDSRRDTTRHDTRGSVSPYA